MANVNSKQAKIFNAASPGFIYSAIVTALTVLAISGVQFGASPEQIAGEIDTTLSGGSLYAVLGIITSSVIFPVWNAIQKGNISFKGIFGNTLTWQALAVLFFSALALFGLAFPEGFGERLVSVIAAKDWTALLNIAFTVIIPTLVRWIKEKRS